MRRDARIAAAMVGLRSPLARIELAAGQLARDGDTPAARALARGISQAVAEVDAGLDAALRALSGGGVAAGASDCRPALESAWARLAPVLRARGVEADLELPRAPVEGDPEAVRRAAVALVRDALGAARPGEPLRVSLRDAGGRYGLSLERAEGSAASVDFARSRALALALPGELELEPAAGRSTLWLPRETTA